MLSRHPGPVPIDEPARQREVDRIAARDCWPAELDQIAAAAADAIGTSGGLVTLIDRDRQLTIGAFNCALPLMPRAETMCAHAIMAPCNVLCVPDLLGDLRFARLGVARGPHAIRFYAGAALIVDAQPVGMLCAVDADRREPITDEQRRALRRLARLASACLEHTASEESRGLAA